MDFLILRKKLKIDDRNESRQKPEYGVALIRSKVIPQYTHIQTWYHPARYQSCNRIRLATTALALRTVSMITTCIKLSMRNSIKLCERKEKRNKTKPVRLNRYTTDLEVQSKGHTQT